MRGNAWDRRMRENCLSGGNGGLSRGDLRLLGRLAAQHISVVVLSTRLEETYFTNEAKIRGDSGVLQGGRSHRAALFRVWKLATPRGGRGRT